MSCNSCELGYYGPQPVPSNAQHVVVDSNNPSASVTVWFYIGDTMTTANAPSLPISLPIPAGTDNITATTSAGSIVVAFDDCATR